MPVVLRGAKQRAHLSLLSLLSLTHISERFPSIQLITALNLGALAGRVPKRHQMRESHYPQSPRPSA